MLGGTADYSSEGAGDFCSHHSSDTRFTEKYQLPLCSFLLLVTLDVGLALHHFFAYPRSSSLRQVTDIPTGKGEEQKPVDSDWPQVTQWFQGRSCPSV